MKTNLILLTICLGLLAGISGFLINKAIYNRTLDITNESDNITFQSTKGFFEIKLPSYVKMTEPESIQEDNYQHGEVWFSFEKSDEIQSKGIIVVYGIPEIQGKGGACPGGYSRQTIRQQQVSVCEDNNYRIEYFKHPTKKIEYWIDTRGLDNGQLNIVKRAIEDSLSFI